MANWDVHEVVQNASQSILAGTASGLIAVRITSEMNVLALALYAAILFLVVFGGSFAISRWVNWIQRHIVKETDETVQQIAS